VKKSFYRYYFKKEQGLDIRYTVELLEHPADNPLSKNYIDEKRKKGVELAAYYKCRAYFRTSKAAYEAETKQAKKTRMTSVASMFAVYLIAFVSSVAMMCYHCVSSLNFTVDSSAEKMTALSEEFSFFGIFVKLAKLIKLDSLLGDYQSTPMVLVFFIATVIFAVPLAIYFRELFLCRSGEKKVGKK
jgi:hypothetical protein